MTVVKFTHMNRYDMNADGLRIKSVKSDWVDFVINLF